jgi:hypothetical protein
VGYDVQVIVDHGRLLRFGKFFAAIL